MIVLHLNINYIWPLDLADTQIPFNSLVTDNWDEQVTYFGHLL